MDQRIYTNLSNWSREFPPDNHFLPCFPWMKLTMSIYDPTTGQFYNGWSGEENDGNSELLARIGGQSDYCFYKI